MYLFTYYLTHPHTCQAKGNLHVYFGNARTLLACCVCYTMLLVCYSTGSPMPTGHTKALHLLFLCGSSAGETR